MPRQKAEELALQYHAAFQALRMGRGSAHGLAVLLQLVVLAGFVDEARKHELRAEVLVATERGVNAALEHGKTCGEWGLDPQTDELVAALIGWHDDQLRTAPLAVFAEALERLERMRDGRSYDRPPARRGSAGSRLG
ncbi:Fis family transcriptional regulator [Burkholderia contaminans]|nr:Fis family transcriptional regulator [Burkholderia contaminans]